MVTLTTRTVPIELLGCWRRDWIRWANGSVDDSSHVIWLQTFSSMADLRVPADRGSASQRRSLRECTDDELLVLAGSESSSGVTIGEPRSGDDEWTAIATWQGSADSVDFQPVSAYPEPGLLRWNDDGSVMTEAAPSGAYVEQWRLLPESRTVIEHHVISTSPRESLYIAGAWAMYVRDRSVAHDSALPLLQRVRTAPRALAEQLVDCEFSVVERR